MGGRVGGNSSFFFFPSAARKFLSSGIRVILIRIEAAFHARDVLRIYSANSSIRNERYGKRQRQIHTLAHTRTQREVENVRETSREKDSGGEEEKENPFKYKFRARPYFIAGASLSYERQEEQAGYHFAPFIFAEKPAPSGKIKYLPALTTRLLGPAEEVEPLRKSATG